MACAEARFSPVTSQVAYGVSCVVIGHVRHKSDLDTSQKFFYIHLCNGNGSVACFDVSQPTLLGVNQVRAEMQRPEQAHNFVFF